MTPIFDLKTPEGLVAASEFVRDHPHEHAAGWTQRLAKFLDAVTKADRTTRASLPFQQQLWDDNPVSGIGQGTIAVGAVIQSQQFREWLADRSLEPLPFDPEARIAALNDLYVELVERFKALPRTPHLKIFRVLAAFFPSDFTSIAHRGSLNRLVRRMRGVAGENPVALHAYVKGRLAEVLGPAGVSQEDQMRRFELPWYLYALTEGTSPGEERVISTTQVPGEEALVPLPAARRRRGLTALAGGFLAALGILQEVKDGLTREEFLDYLRALHPSLKENSRGMIINILRSELGVIKNVNNEYLLTDRGAAVLETSDASELGDWLLTRILGIDHILKKLKSGPSSKADLIALLQKANPGWTTDFAPTSTLTWLNSMKAIHRGPDGLYRLEAIGQEWFERIAWEPEFLQIDEDDKEEPIALVEAPADKFSLPPLAMIVDKVQTSGAFDPSLVEQLHIGLWSPGKRHFAVLAGISGSGKTLLAMKYAESLASGDAPAQQYMVQAVQPGWYDPTPLLGYLNPLQKNTYQRTAFLAFLIRASQDPFRPYVAVLDEMNLSHPEQYFAPLLSTMETGAPIRLHAEGDTFDGIPESIPYPANLAIIGTINMDETTHGLSDKVLDRAFTLEFWDIDVAMYPRWGKHNIPLDQEAKIRQVLEQLMKALAPSRLHFGWRVMDDVMDFLASAKVMEAKTGFDALLDSIVYAKILPKIRGEDSPRMRETLENARVSLVANGLPRCSIRVAELQAELMRAGSARFWR